MFNKVKSKVKNIKQEIKLAQDSFSHVSDENNKLMIALGYYGKVCKELIKQGFETVEDLDLIREHKQAQEITTNIANYVFKSMKNYNSPENMRKERYDVYEKLETLLKFCLDNNIKTMKLKFQKGLLRKNHKIDLEVELEEVKELMQECSI